jgi:hypothetical protein
MTVFAERKETSNTLLRVCYSFCFRYFLLQFKFRLLPFLGVCGFSDTYLVRLIKLFSIQFELIQHRLHVE